MSLPIKDNPVLTGDDARRFIENMNNAKAVSREEYERAKAIYEAITK